MADLILTFPVYVTFWLRVLGYSVHQSTA